MPQLGNLSSQQYSYQLVALEIVKAKSVSRSMSISLRITCCLVKWDPLKQQRKSLRPGGQISSYFAAENMQVIRTRWRSYLLSRSMQGSLPFGTLLVAGSKQQPSASRRVKQSKILMASSMVLLFSSKNCLPVSTIITTSFSRVLCCLVVSFIRSVSSLLLIFSTSSLQFRLSGEAGRVAGFCSRSRLSSRQMLDLVLALVFMLFDNVYRLRMKQFNLSGGHDHFKCDLDLQGPQECQKKMTSKESVWMVS